MDLNTILTKLSPQHFEHYQSLESFISDIRLLFSNCFVYNSVSIAAFYFVCWQEFTYVNLAHLCK